VDNTRDQNVFPVGPRNGFSGAIIDKSDQAVGCSQVDPDDGLPDGTNRLVFLYFTGLEVDAESMLNLAIYALWSSLVNAAGA